MKLEIVKNMVAITTPITLEQLQSAGGKLIAIDEKENPFFRIGYAAGKEGSLTTSGCTFNAKNKDGSMVCNFLLAQDKSSIQDVRKTFGESLLNLSSCEDQCKSKLAAQAAKLDALFATATIAQ